MENDNKYVVRVKFPDTSEVTVWDDEHRTMQVVGNGYAYAALFTGRDLDPLKRVQEQISKAKADNCHISTNMFDSREVVQGQVYPFDAPWGAVVDGLAYFAADKDHPWCLLVQDGRVVKIEKAY